MIIELLHKQEQWREDTEMLGSTFILEEQAWRLGDLEKLGPVTFGIYLYATATVTSILAISPPPLRRRASIKSRNRSRHQQLPR